MIVGLRVCIPHQTVNPVLSSVLRVDSGLAPEEALAHLLSVRVSERLYG